MCVCGAQHIPAGHVDTLAGSTRSSGHRQRSVIAAFVLIPTPQPRSRRINLPPANNSLRPHAASERSALLRDQIITSLVYGRACCHECADRSESEQSGGHNTQKVALLHIFGSINSHYWGSFSRDQSVTDSKKCNLQFSSKI